MFWNIFITKTVFLPNCSKVDYGHNEAYPEGQGKMDTSAQGTFLVKCLSYLRHRISFIFIFPLNKAYLSLLIRVFFFSNHFHNQKMTEMTMLLTLQLQIMMKKFIPKDKQRMVKWIMWYWILKTTGNLNRKFFKRKF